MDDDHAAKVTGKTIERYRAAARSFSDWLEENGLSPGTVDEWDDLLVEWKNDAREQVSKAAFTNAVAAVELALPHARGRLQWCHAVTAGLSVASHVSHTLPEPWGCTLVLAAAWARHGLCPVAAIRLLQHRR